RFYLLFPLLIFIYAEGFSQGKTSDSRKPSIDNLMQDRIRQLKNGALLVRLQTKEYAINALRKAGNEKIANRVESEQFVFNKALIAAFRSNFTFCPVYFFQSQHSEHLLNDHPEAVVFMDDNMKPDSSVKCISNFFLTADIGTLEQDTATYFDRSYYAYNGIQKTYSGGPDIGIEVFKIMDNHFVQLCDPFPYYVRTFNYIYVKRKLTNVAKRMNKKLTKYYAETAEIKT